MDVYARSPAGPWRTWAATLWLLTALFSLRVVGQALQRWLPQPWLPPFPSWQGSTTPYPLLLAIQFVILGAMACAAYGAWQGRIVPSRRRMLWTAWIGAAYMAAAIARLAIGLASDEAPAWFDAWISSAFHVVLAAFVLALSRYHFLRDPARGGAAQ